VHRLHSSGNAKLFKELSGKNNTKVRPGKNPLTRGWDMVCPEEDCDAGINYGGPDNATLEDLDALCGEPDFSADQEVDEDPRSDAQGGSASLQHLGGRQEGGSEPSNDDGTCSAVNCLHPRGGSGTHSDKCRRHAREAEKQARILQQFNSREQAKGGDNNFVQAAERKVAPPAPAPAPVPARRVKKMDALSALMKRVSPIGSNATIRRWSFCNIPSFYVWSLAH
jgi:hypothetical protein